MTQAALPSMQLPASSKSEACLPQKVFIDILGLVGHMEPAAGARGQREEGQSAWPDPGKSLPGRRGLRMAQEKEFDFKGRREVVQKEGPT